MSSKSSTNLTLNEGVKKMARELMAVKSFSTRTALVEQLIRDKHAAIFGEGAGPRAGVAAVKPLKPVPQTVKKNSGKSKGAGISLEIPPAPRKGKSGLSSAAGCNGRRPVVVLTGLEAELDAVRRGQAGVQAGTRKVQPPCISGRK